MARWIVTFACLSACVAPTPRPVLAPTPAPKAEAPKPVAPATAPHWTPIEVSCAKVAALAPPSTTPKWTARASGTSETLTAVHGSASDDVWVVGDAGVVLHSTDHGFTMERCSLPESLSAVFALGGGEVWIGGTSTVFRRTKDQWFSRAPASGAISSIWASSKDDVWMVAGDKRLMHATADGTIWTEDTHCLHTSHVFGRTPQELFLECSFFVERSIDGGATWAPSSFQPQLESGYAIHGAVSDVWIVGTSGEIAASFDGGVTFAPVPGPSTFGSYHDVWSLGQGRVFVVGGGVHLRVASVWTTQIAEEVGIASVWASGITDAWAVGRNGTVLHRP